MTHTFVYCSVHCTHPLRAFSNRTYLSYHCMYHSHHCVLIRRDRMSHTMSKRVCSHFTLTHDEPNPAPINPSSTYIKSFFGTTNSSPILRRSHSSFLVLIFRGLSVRWFRWSFFSFYSKGGQKTQRTRFRVGLIRLLSFDVMADLTWFNALTFRLRV